MDLSISGGVMKLANYNYAERDRHFRVQKAWGFEVKKIKPWQEFQKISFQFADNIAINCWLFQWCSSPSTTFKGRVCSNGDSAPDLHMWTIILLLKLWIIYTEMLSNTLWCQSVWDSTGAWLFCSQRIPSWNCSISPSWRKPHSGMKSAVNEVLCEEMGRKQK